MVNGRFVVSLIISLLVLSFFVLADLPSIIENVARDRVENDCLAYFYGVNCAGCEQTGEYMQQLQIRYPQLQIQKYEVYHSKENYALLLQYFTSYGVPPASQGIPVVFMPESYFVGKETIRSLLEDRIRENTIVSCPSVQLTNAVGVVGERESPRVIDTLTFITLSRSALQDSFGPGAIALILVLLAALFTITSDTSMLRKGFIFVLGVYIAFFLYGFGQFTWFAGSKLSFVLYKLVGLVAVILGLLNIKGFFRTWDAWLETVSETWRVRGRRSVQVITSLLGMFVLGFLGSFFAFGETSVSFTSLQLLLADESTQVMVWPLLLYYTFIFVLHLIAVVLFIYFIRLKLHGMAKQKGEFSAKAFELWEKHNRRLLNFAISAIMLVLGLLVLFI